MDSNGILQCQKLTVIICEIACDCEEDDKESFLQSRLLLGVVIVWAPLMLSFPNCGNVIYPNTKISKSIHTQGTVKYEIEICVMTCIGCEEHVRHKAGKLPYISEPDVSYNKGNEIVSFDISMRSKDSVEKAIGLTGYKVQSENRIN